MAISVRPSIFQRRSLASPDITEELGISVPDWSDVMRMKGRSGGLRADSFLDRVRPQLSDINTKLKRSMLSQTRQ